MQTVIIFLLVLSLLVVVHEGGHFFAAKFFNMKVYEFGMGFPPRAFGFYTDPETGERVWVWGKGKDSLKETVSGEESQEKFPDTLYSINWLPLGGFVQIKGENGENLEDEDSFGHKAPWKRIIVLSAGVIMNFVLAGILLAGGFVNGLPTSAKATKDPNAIVLQEPQVMVQKVQSGTPAEKAGLKMGDRILAVNGTAVSQSKQLVEYVENNANQELSLKINRNGEIMSVSAKPKKLEGAQEEKLGVRLSDSAVVKYPWYIAIYKGFVAAVSGTVTIVAGFYMLLKNLILGQGMVFEVSGPVG
ncbi:MAG: RIP metalloprotease, partial [Candidatus Magasanikbacteria bacterium]